MTSFHVHVHRIYHTLQSSKMCRKCFRLALAIMFTVHIRIHFLPVCLWADFKQIHFKGYITLTYQTDFFKTGKIENKSFVFLAVIQSPN